MHSFRAFLDVNKNIRSDRAGAGAGAAGGGAVGAGDALLDAAGGGGGVGISGAKLGGMSSGGGGGAGGDGHGHGGMGDDAGSILSKGGDGSILAMAGSHSHHGASADALERAAAAREEAEQGRLDSIVERTVGLFVDVRGEPGQPLAMVDPEAAAVRLEEIRMQLAADLKAGGARVRGGDLLGAGSFPAAAFAPVRVVPASEGATAAAAAAAAAAAGGDETKAVAQATADGSSAAAAPTSAAETVAAKERAALQRSLLEEAAVALPAAVSASYPGSDNGYSG